MSANSFNTLLYVKKLRAAGFSQEQAEAQAEALVEIIDENLSTKRDLKELESRLIIRLGTLIAFSTGILATLIKIL